MVGDSLQEVSLFDYYYLCIVYALRRVGSNLSVEDFLKLPKQDFSSTSVYDKGTLLVWDDSNKSVSVEYPTIITPDRLIITPEWNIGYHVAVVEDYRNGQILFSELTYADFYKADVIPYSLPILQCRVMTESMRKPHYVVFPVQLQREG